MIKKKFPEGFYWGETGMGPRRKAGAAWLRGGVAQNRSSDLCVTDVRDLSRKAGARRREAGSRKFSAENYA